MQQQIEKEEPTGLTHTLIEGKSFENHIVSQAMSAVGEAVEEGDGNDEEEYSPRMGSTQVRQVRECMDAIRKDRGRKKLEADARQAQRAKGSALQNQRWHIGIQNVSSNDDYGPGKRRKKSSAPIVSQDDAGVSCAFDEDDDEDEEHIDLLAAAPGTRLTQKLLTTRSSRSQRTPVRFDSANVTELRYRGTSQQGKRKAKSTSDSTSTRRSSHTTHSVVSQPSEGVAASSGGNMVVCDSMHQDEQVVTSTRLTRGTLRTRNDQLDEDGGDLQAEVRRRLDTTGESMSARLATLLDNLCDREHANLFIDFATSQVPADYESVVNGPAIDLGIVVRTLSTGGYADASLLTDAVVKVFDNTIAYYRRRGIQDTQELARHARTLRRWWVEEARRITDAPSTNISYESHRQTNGRARQGQTRTQVDSARATSNSALHVVARKKTMLEVEDGNFSGQDEQRKLELERELLHAERILHYNISASAYLRIGPFELLGQ